jgi:hypothetical protein
MSKGHNSFASKSRPDILCRSKGVRWYNLPVAFDNRRLKSLLFPCSANCMLFDDPFLITVKTVIDDPVSVVRFVA